MDFQEKLQEFFLRQYKDGLEKSNLFIAFEPIGCMIDELDPADPQSKTRANEQLSILAERLPAIQESMTFGSSRFTDIWETMVYSSTFRENLLADAEKEDYRKIFNQAKAETIAKLEQGKRASVVTATGSYYLVTGQPDAWYNKDASVWISKSFSQKIPEQVDQPDKPFRFDLKWKRIDQTKLSTSVQQQFEGLIKRNPAIKKTQWHKPLAKQQLNMNLLHAKTQLIRRPAINFQVKPMLVSESKPLLIKPLLSKRIAMTQMLQRDKLLIQQQPEADRFELSFDYCMVNLRRDWFDRSLLNCSKLWYSKALEKNFFSNGMKDSSNQGELKCMTTAMILVKNLKISANWSTQDLANSEESMSLGFFNIADSRINSKNELINPGIQALGWICEVFPALPSISDPILFE